MTVSHHEPKALSNVLSRKWMSGYQLNPPFLVLEWVVMGGPGPGEPAMQTSWKDESATSIRFWEGSASVRRPHLKPRASIHRMTMGTQAFELALIAWPQTANQCFLYAKLELV